jgi:hypothetical protein
MNMEKSDGKLSAQHVYTLGVGNENWFYILLSFYYKFPSPNLRVFDIYE